MLNFKSLILIDKSELDSMLTSTSQPGDYWKYMETDDNNSNIQNLIDTCDTFVKTYYSIEPVTIMMDDYNTIVSSTTDEEGNEVVVFAQQEVTYNKYFFLCNLGNKTEDDFFTTFKECILSNNQ